MEIRVWEAERRKLAPPHSDSNTNAGLNFEGAP